MFTSVTDRPKRSRRVLKTLIVYLTAAAFCMIFDQVYALFGHGVYSGFMSLMFLYPLIGGGLVFLLLWLFDPHVEDVAHYRVLYNSYNSGIAALTLGSLLNGVFEIAGTSSQYMTVFIICSIALCAAGLAGYCIGLFRRACSRRTSHGHEAGQKRAADEK